jgi:acetamidase/formamidase
LATRAPALEIDPGDTVRTFTVDAGGQDKAEEQVTDRGNPQSGPFGVRGAQEGDILVVTFDTMVPNRSRGWTSSRLAPFAVDAYRAADDFPEDIGLIPWIVDVENGTARVEEPTPGLESLVIPLNPMLGCFGVAPAGGQAIAASTSGPHGGNMDYNGFTAGSTVYLPVSADGGLFSLGDGHATQGDGEIAGTGIEISFDVTFTAGLLKDRRISWPRGRDDDGIFTVGNFRPLDDALRIATTEMSAWLQEMGLSQREAHLLLGQCVEYRVGNMFDPAYTMVCRISHDVLEGIGLDASTVGGSE